MSKNATNSNTNSNTSNSANNDINNNTNNRNVNSNNSVGILRNQEFKSILIKLTILVLIFGAIGFIIASFFMGKINDEIVEQNQALVGNILKDYPELEKAIIPYITKNIHKDAIEIGQEVLKSYGYNLKMNKSLQPILKDINQTLQITNFIITFLFLVSLGFVANKEYSWIYKKVKELSMGATKVVEGDFNVSLKDEGEGEFNILYHQFNQMANRLENTLQALEKDKIFLKNTISDISHQLKTPLSSLIMLNDLMLDNENMEQEVKIKFLQKSKIQLERMEWLTINLLKVARIEAGAIDFKKEKILLIDAVEIALSTLATPVPDLSIEVLGNVKAAFHGDKDWTAEALINLIKNSIEHSQKGENSSKLDNKGDKCKIKIILDETPLFSSIIIKDNGEGIDEKDIPHVFERFYKGKSEIKPESIGIGLNLTKLIIESQNGAISVKSQKGQGTEFTISFLKGII